ncbi:MAG TPA: hypothetical protein VK479_13130 [Micropepsaceae bacterium]|nr:hypothetical protein [Micropepsaceae bacterium]
MDQINDLSPGSSVPPVWNGRSSYHKVPPQTNGGAPIPNAWGYTSNRAQILVPFSFTAAWSHNKY